MKQIAVIGGGAAGMMAALAAALRFMRKMRSWGKKFISPARDAAM